MSFAVPLVRDSQLTLARIVNMGVEALPHPPERVRRVGGLVALGRRRCESGEGWGAGTPHPLALLDFVQPVV